MKERLKDSTSYPTCFLMVSSTDHVTPVTGLTPTVVISKNGGAFASPSGAVSEIGNGWYALAGNSTDRNTLGEFLIHATGTGADPVDDRYMITAYDPFDAVRLGLTALPNAAADAAGGLPISDAGGLDLDSKLAHTEEVTAARMGALTDLINGGRLDLLIDAILADTNELQTDLTNGGRIDLLIDSILADTNELQVELAEGGRTDLLIDAILADTNELQTDWHDGGRLDLLLDALLTRLSETRAGYIDYLASGTYGLNALLTAINTRLAGADYTEPDNTSIANTINALNDVTYGLSALLTAINSRLASTEYTAPPTVLEILAGQIESGLTLAHAMQILVAVVMKASGGGTSSIAFRNYGDSKNRIVMTVDENGNRSSVVVSFD